MNCYYLKHLKNSTHSYCDSPYGDCYSETEPNCENCDDKFPPATAGRAAAMWTGGWPALCCGEWVLYIEGKNVTNKIPEELRTSSMNTLGKYQTWHFENWEEVWNSYTDGLDRDSWIAENDYWLSTITPDRTLKEEIYEAIQAEDWRHNSCGGCI